MRNIALFVIITFFSSQTYAQAWRDGDLKFDFSKRLTNSAKVNIHTVDNVWQTCEKESRKRGLGGFGISVDACTFWNHGPLGSTCDIYFSKKTSMHEIGHEIRHCFAGSFH